MGLDHKELDKILDWFNKSNLSSAKIECDADGGYKITMSRDGGHSQNHVVHATMPTSAHPPQQSSSPEAHTVSTETGSGAEPNTEQVTSPIVGTFYRAPGPDSPPFAQEGDTIKKGATLCIIEAMKVMNEFEAEYDMEIVSVLVDNSTLVEFGQALFEVKPL